MSSSELVPGPVLITGGTGTFGSLMLRDLLDRGVDEVRVLSRDETKQDSLRRELGDERVRFYLGDVRDPASVEDATRGTSHVFHAAALKQVPSCELFPQQAVATNVVGSDNVLRAADRAGVASVVCLSTDKAVHPVNAMGMSKALMEKVAQAHARHRSADGPVVSITRYGNVLHSRGSVVPLFLEQARTGRPLTVTDPAMTRFLLSPRDAVDLVHHAFTHAEPGDVFVRKAPVCTVRNLALAVASLFGEDDPEVLLVGARQGEKRHESLLTREELGRSLDQGDYFRVPLDAVARDGGLVAEPGDPRVVDGDYTSRDAERLGVAEVRDLLLGLEPVRRVLAEAGVTSGPGPCGDLEPTSRVD